MRRSLMIAVAAAAVVACGAPAVSASSMGAARRALASGGTWGTAKVVPGTAALNTEGEAGVGAVSCASAGNCGMGGFYSTLVRNHDFERPFVGSETNGTWGHAREVRGLSALHVTHYAYVSTASCASAGNCSAGGFYDSKSTGGPRQLFVVSETGGTWGTAEAVTGIPFTGNPDTFSVSCGAAGDCGAVGDYSNAPDQVQAFVLNQAGGTWGTAEQAPGTAALNTGEHAGLTSVSCASAGNCSAGGFYTDSSGHHQAFVISETSGTWRTAEKVPGAAALNAGGNAAINSVSCASAGNCSAGGYYNDGSALQAFVVNETNGTWAKAKEVPGTAALNVRGTAETGSVSCASAGNCSAAGYYSGSSFVHPFVVSETNGTWGTAEQVPGMTALNAIGSAFVTAVSCGAAGNCSVGGYYDVDGHAGTQAWVADQTGGTWGNAENLPGTSPGSPSNGNGSSIASVSCISATRCVAGGTNPDSSGGQQAIVDSRS